MKTMTKFFALSIIALAFSASVFAQATATATATIVTPITITKVTDMSFGNVVPSATLLGTFVLAPDATPTLTNVSQIGSPSATAAVTAATFTVAGTPGAIYDITLPGAAVTLTSPSAATMTVDAFTSTPTPAGTLDASLGTQTLSVGATLHVGIAQAAGTYLSVPFTVTVNYQ